MNKNILIFIVVIILIVTGFNFSYFLEEESLVHDEINPLISVEGGINGFKKQHSVKELRVELSKNENIEDSFDIPIGSIDERITDLEQTISELSN